MTRISAIATTETDMANVDYVPGIRSDSTDVKIPGSLFGSAAGFRVTKITSDQSLTGGASPSQITFNSEEFDATGVFASNAFTVPAAWDGKLALLVAGVRFGGNVDGSIYLWNNTDSTYRAQASTATPSTGTAVPGAVVSSVETLVSGDVWHVHGYANLTQDVKADERTFFAAIVF